MGYFVIKLSKSEGIMDPLTLYSCIFLPSVTYLFCVVLPPHYPYIFVVLVPSTPDSCVSLPPLPPHSCIVFPPIAPPLLHHFTPKITPFLLHHFTTPPIYPHYPSLMRRITPPPPNTHTNDVRVSRVIGCKFPQLPLNL